MSTITITERLRELFVVERWWYSESITRALDMNHIVHHDIRKTTDASRKEESTGFLVSKLDQLIFYNKTWQKNLRTYRLYERNEKSRIYY